ncbi:hypothetical protein MSP8887_00621 [Marinomonas spartinae]|uniref:hypothetical protein n=1 Tax=Marinomonas spartinae TaxID=1792290 RepID=UPI000809071E|nr:hypothetical protein [Marinomonas spartinae]SBS27355.1 hypothetical protein MSP8887_00621 [Marinomonas spartinae]
MTNFTIELAESELKLVLESLIEMESKMANICDTSDDEDEIADIGNELIELRLFLKPLIERSVKEYGKGILNFSRELL